MKAALLVCTFAALVASPAVAQDVPEWSFVDTGESAALTYAIPESDDGGPSFHCTLGEGVVHVLMFVEKRIATENPRDDGTWVNAKGAPAPWPGELRITFHKPMPQVPAVVGGKAVVPVMVKTTTLPAQVSPDEMSGGSMVDAVIPTGSLKTFAEGGYVELQAFGETRRLPLTPTGSAKRLLAACAKR